MKFDPVRHHRRSVRLRGYDYARNGAYFVTLCTHDRQPLFGDVIRGEMRLTRVGAIVAEEWVKSSTVRIEIDLDAFVIMPNHLHGIVIIDTPVGAYDHTPLPSPRATTFVSPSRTLGAMIRGFKSATTLRINEMRDTPRVPVWQRGYHDHIVRNAYDLKRVRKYVAENPRQWRLDRENPGGKRFGLFEPWEVVAP